MLSVPCVPKDFADVFEIPHERLPPDEHHTLAVDLVEPGKDALAGPWREVASQKCFQDALPWILVTLWRGLTL